MLKAIRYTLTTICLAASVGCLALWWRSDNQRDFVAGPSVIVPGHEVGLGTAMGICTALSSFDQPPSRWSYENTRISESEREFKQRFVKTNGHFVSKMYGGGTAVYFPLWYSALVFALAGIAASRIGRQFTLRSALAATTVVAALLGMVVAL